jgi:hypothetical protein
MATITEQLTDAIKMQDRPLEVRDADGGVYYVLTESQFRRYVYDDSELTDDEMIAAAAVGLDHADATEQDPEQAD